MGTTHADHFRGDVPVTRSLTPDEIAGDYEAITGRVIAETFESEGIDPLDVQAVLVANHGPFVWGPTSAKAVESSVVLEFLARMNLHQHLLAPGAPRPHPDLIAKHYDRKHGKTAYYGQKT
jgi:L-ribulose-5-phosphate 4-epimerase